MFSGKDIPSVGASIGIERLMALLGDRLNEEEVDSKCTAIKSVFIASVGNQERERMQLCKLLWTHGIRAETSYKQAVKAKKQFERADDLKVDITIVFGEDELNQGIQKVKDMKSGVQVDVQVEQIVSWIQGDVGQVQVQGEERVKGAIQVNKGQKDDSVVVFEGKKNKYMEMEIKEIDKILGQKKYLNGEQITGDDYQLFEKIVKDFGNGKNEFADLTRWVNLMSVTNKYN